MTSYLILGHLRSANYGALAQPKIQLLKLFKYIAIMGISVGVYGQESEPSAIRLSGELMYMTQGVGLLPKKGGFNPGYRVSVDRERFLSFVDFGAVYTRWGAEREKSFSMPILNKTQKIRNEDCFYDLELMMSHPFSLFKGFQLELYVGIDWDWKDHVTTISERWVVVDRQRGWGPLVGLSMKEEVYPGIAICGGASFAYLEGNDQRVINTIVHGKHRYHVPKCKLRLGMEGTLPLDRGSIRIKGGYETQYFWEQGMEGTIDWSIPFYLQGFTAQASWDF
ncbi:MAG: Lpg1974 family pore-forming outer membrane protein [Parachlamydiales bacterium]